MPNVARTQRHDGKWLCFVCARVCMFVGAWCEYRIAACVGAPTYAPIRREGDVSARRMGMILCICMATWVRRRMHANIHLHVYV